ncbi:flavin-containing monooxygenase [Mycobacterium montefiorense]|uniref:flavin-containing monooxygenase n=1 Tax=Mycobacterium montefiorense TaxID=154654 RepID=UPI001F37EB1F|nr:NAD(P)/FAD-dependent oxidoreductase [Mycobacterium montefiorense]
MIDRADEVASRWRNYTSMTGLMTGKWFSHIPGRPYPRHTPRFPSCDQVAEYFNRHAHRDGIELRLGTDVKRIDRWGSKWRLTTSGGVIEAGEVVVATAYANIPYLPKMKDMNKFRGELLHTSSFGEPDRYRGKRVLVIGAGPSGLQAAHDIAPVADKVWLAVRTPPNLVARQSFWGNSVDIVAGPLFHAPVRAADAIARFVQRRTIGDLTRYGLPFPDEGPFTLAARNVPVAVVDMEVIASVRNGAVEVVSTIERFHGTSVTLVDGMKLEPDVVICATGYRTGLGPLVGHLDVLDKDEVPIRFAPEPAANGLWFIGYQRRPALIGHAARQSRRLAKCIAAREPAAQSA